MIQFSAQSSLFKALEDFLESNFHCHILLMTDAVFTATETPLFQAAMISLLLNRVTDSQMQTSAR